MKIAIIGAGAAGLTAAKHSLEHKHTIDVFEQTGNFGGTWIYHDGFDVDEEGIPIHSSMYQGLKTNLPKELMEYEDFTYPKDMEMSFIPQAAVLKYIQDYVKNFDLEKHIKLYHQVINIEPMPNQKWNLKSLNLKTKVENEGTYDAVLVCNGHYRDFVIPNIPGKDNFKGHWTHSQYYRSSKLYENKRVVVVGAGPSGCDIARLVSDVAKKVYISYKGESFVQLASKITCKPRISEILRNSVIFENKEEIEIDAIIYCTGYNYSFPFLSKNCGIEIEENWVKPLYKHVININNPTMGFIGIPVKNCPFPVSEVQVRFYLSYLSGNFTKTKEEMMHELNEEIKNKNKKKLRKSEYHVLGDLQNEYCEQLTKVGNIPPIKPVIGKLYNYQRKLRITTGIYKILNDNEFVRSN